MPSSPTELGGDAPNLDMDHHGVGVQYNAPNCWTSQFRRHLFGFEAADNLAPIAGEVNRVTQSNVILRP